VGDIYKSYELQGELKFYERPWSVQRKVPTYSYVSESGEARIREEHHLPGEKL
jgi:hypothetical protein